MAVITLWQADMITGPRFLLFFADRPAGLTEDPS
jgi:hypothetical protein